MNSPFPLRWCRAITITTWPTPWPTWSGTKHVKDLRPVIWGLLSAKEIPGKTPLKLTTKITPDDNCRICRIKCWKRGLSTIASYICDTLFDSSQQLTEILLTCYVRLAVWRTLHCKQGFLLVLGEIFKHWKPLLEYRGKNPIYPHCPLRIFNNTNQLNWFVFVCKIL